jgi:hypothetical protein
VVIQGSAPPTIVRTEQVWRRADYRAWRRDGAALALPAAGESTAAGPQPAELAAGEPPRWPERPADELAARRDRAGAERADIAAGDGDDAAPAPAAAPRPPSRPAPWDEPGAPGQGDGHPAAG